ncbi:MAG: hypothetical protein MUO76_08775, partial [Anaerolineaceae bacterium]|nr:hypothetical protein [Anaerolineaceae bacterium]
MSRFVILLLFCLVLTACQTVSPTATPTVLMELTNTPSGPSPTSFMLSSATPEPEPTVIATGSPPLALATHSPVPPTEMFILNSPVPLVLRDYQMSIPEG